MSARLDSAALAPSASRTVLGGCRMVALSAALLAASACAGSEATRRADRDGELLVLDLAREFVARGAYDAAVPMLKRAAAEHPESAEVHVLYGVVLRERGVYAHSEAELRRAIELRPEAAPAHAALAMLLDLMRRPDDALRAHRRAVNLAPGNGRYWNNLGFSLLVNGRTDEAIAALERAVALDPSLAVAYNNLGFAHGRIGHYDVALRHFRTAGGERAAKLNLALVYERNGDAAKAAALRTEVAK